jgi:hypothetical protein
VNHLEGPRSPLICVSERTFLPVVVPRSRASDFPRALADALALLLEQLEIPRALIEEERLAMGEWSWAKTENRSVLGVMNDHSNLARILLSERLPLPALNLRSPRTS